MPISVMNRFFAASCAFSIFVRIFFRRVVVTFADRRLTTATGRVMHHLPIHPDEEGMGIGHLDVKHRQGLTLGAYINNFDARLGIRVPAFEQ